MAKGTRKDSQDTVVTINLVDNSGQSNRDKSDLSLLNTEQERQERISKKKNTPLSREHSKDRLTSGQAAGVTDIKENVRKESSISTFSIGSKESEKGVECNDLNENELKNRLTGKVEVQERNEASPKKIKSRIPVSNRENSKESTKIVKDTERNNGSLSSPGLSEEGVDLTSDKKTDEIKVPRTESTNSIKSLRSDSQRSSASISRNNSVSEVSASNNIKVVVRIRPLSDSEKKKGEKHVIENPEKGVIWVDTSNGHTKPFSFTSVCGEKISQEEVFCSSGIKDLIYKALEGFSCTAFAFGQTGSGKTYTITGPVSQDLDRPLPKKELQGLLPRSFEFLFEELAKQESVYILKASFLEVYNEKVQDLLNPSNYHDSLPLRWSSDRGFYVDNLFTVECENQEDLLNVLKEGLRYRQMGGHALNEHSSRSHSMLTIYIDSEVNDPGEEFPILKHGKISFVDLAGSERVKESKVSGEALTESQNINKSLLTLGNCIAALGDPKKRGGHIPYRDSKLTKLLADSLGGDGFTLMIACVSPSSEVVQDTLNTLRYANRAKNIKNKPVVRMDPREQLIMRLKRDIKLLKSENSYFREQVGVPSSDSQVAIPVTQFEGIVSPTAQSGSLSSAIGTNSLSSLHSSNKDGQPKALKPEEENRATTAMYALNASFGLYDMLQGYMNENEALRNENLELHQSRVVIQKQHEMLSRENEKLARKLESLERVFVSSPLSPGSRTSGMSGLTSREESVSPWSLIRQRYLTRSGRQTQKPGRDNSGSKREDSGEKISFPPVPKGTYPNYTAQDLSEDFAMESRKLKEERAKKDKQGKNSQYTNARSGQGSVSSNDNDSKVGEREQGVSAGEINVHLEENNNIVNGNRHEDAFRRKSIDSETDTDSKVVKQSTKGTKLSRKPPVQKFKSWKHHQHTQKDKKKGGYAALFAMKKGRPKGIFGDISSSQYNTSDDQGFYSTKHDAYSGSTNALPHQYGMVPGYGPLPNVLREDLQHLEGQIRNEFLWKQKPGFE